MKKTETFEIDWEYEPGKTRKEEVIIKKLGFGEKNEFRERNMEVQMMGEIPKTTVHIFTSRTNALQACIVKAPFPTDIPTLNELDDDVGELIYKKIDKLNKLSPEKKKDSKTSSAKE